ncbi:MAG: hypothetical protein OEQ12_03400 [Nitrosopumilus sp.]|nr:hypothetical protein [Nitrosopumilus sp.]
MPDSILDDVQALLDKEFGDKRILEQILRAAQNNEVISNFERNYVRKLAEKHLGKKPPVEKKIPEVTKQITSDMTIPIPSPIGKTQTTQTFVTSPKITKSNSKNTQIILGVGLAALVIIILGSVYLSGISDMSSPTLKPNQTPTSSNSFSIQTDFSSYQKGDIISISGKSNLISGTQINLSIENLNDDLIWSEQVNVKSNGQFSTLTFAGGFGWEQTGIFTIKAESNSEQAENTFSFTG